MSQQDDKLSTLIALLSVVSEKQQNIQDMIRKVETAENTHNDQHSFIITAMHDNKHEIELLSNEMNEHRKDTALLLPKMENYTLTLSQMLAQLESITESLKPKPKSYNKGAVIIIASMLGGSGIYKIFEILLKGISNG